MNKIEQWILKKIAEKWVIQGNHRRKIIRFYEILIDAARDQFREDTIPGLKQQLRECHEEALAKDPKDG